MLSSCLGCLTKHVTVKHYLSAVFILTTTLTRNKEHKTKLKTFAQNWSDFIAGNCSKCYTFISLNVILLVLHLQNKYVRKTQTGVCQPAPVFK